MARSFNGSTDKIVIGTGGGVGASHEFSISLWVYATSFASNWCMVAKRDSFTIGSDQFSVTTGNNNGALGLAKNASFFQASDKIVLNRWNHVGFAGDASGLIAKLDGVDMTDDGSSTLGLAGNWVSGTGTGQSFSIGVLNTENIYFLQGRLADVALWNSKLSSPELITLSTGVRPASVQSASLVSWYPLDGYASPESDFGSNNLAGTLTGTARASGPPLVERPFGA